MAVFVKLVWYKGCRVMAVFVKMIANQSLRDWLIAMFKGYGGCFSIMAVFLPHNLCLKIHKTTPTPHRQERIKQIQTCLMTNSLSQSLYTIPDLLLVFCLCFVCKDSVQCACKDTPVSVLPYSYIPTKFYN
jgi:hypothetical protein